MLRTIKNFISAGILHSIFLIFLTGTLGACLDSTLKNDFDPEAGIGIAVPIILGIQANSDKTCYYDKISSIYDTCVFGQ